MVAHNRKLKQITFDLGGVEYQCQVVSWQMVNNSEDGEKRYTYCPDGEFREETDPDWSLELTFYSDWRSGGISDFLTLQDGQDVAFQLDHHPDIPAEHVRWTGTVTVKAPSVGGEVRTTEQTEVTLPCVGKPVYSRP
ncbi:hypothetical protein [Pseudonocardia asaccharolytica]|uniref:Phage tail protein n=1 Tax=Pseudonocardia asaccharolytica DSM 44247 = NBRC 16224 TaxID=1123024 RepID=A0A511D459_9PSEU|nr:hypothetical protein [Pseudonocardia asaccharolytica]GEL17688.1 hypothetical protein PA7_15250 [Pseudonocardia asaccharolytica DSM 44247 = NBRC 16224]